ncbi:MULTISPECIES: FAD-dependent monooxygenase [unclassified Beijerinckia]|uniref:FAD-dependent monooxygenase n=1 Tax=unclassified Beijerinckia TaxID=2638183 RepID=UPI00089A400E|nr:MULTISPECIES: FAD-dependent monooxygenase [unclassified Beijerinckia]MDH7796166.1 2-polyprenyl-6-methoxyphenol hydroxylase-like FAD-dependent oxidoreductase [Beijerinckia sp. GAS462]SEC33242.1 2-polyprenyl-6-methoxyphenol hydroxylase [Beijerinckia sp. 28-YEA-48]
MDRQLPSDTEVLIIGAGPVGLALAIELGSRGVSCLVVERNDRVGYNPRAKTTNVRTREHLRRWGIADKLRAASPVPVDYPATVVFATRLNGPEICRFENALQASPDKNNLYSESAQWVPQYVLEQVLRDHAVSLPGVTVRFETEFEAARDFDDHVEVTLRDLQQKRSETISCRYLIGADGARSAVREHIGAKMHGPGGALRNINLVMRAPGLDRMHPHGRAIHYWLLNEEIPSLMGPLDGGDLWYYIVTKFDGDGVPDAETCKDMIRRSTAIDFDPEIVGIDPWVARSLVADHYAKGRVFLAGDACHLHPPFGGFGMNMGIGDAVDLGWKLAATIQGWGGPALLESYTTERRPVHERIIEEATINYSATGNQLIQPGLEDPGEIGAAIRREVAETILATKAREFKTLGVVLGSHYAHSPIVAEEKGEPPPQSVGLYTPTAYPGCLAPHQWLKDGRSLYDLFCTGYTLLVLSDDAEGVDRFRAAAAEQRVPLTIVKPGDTRLPRRYEAKLALIRPDQHVAWRGNAAPDDITALFARVTGRAMADVH